MEIKIKVQPKSSINSIIGFREDTLIIKTTSAPDKGKANNSIIKLISKKFKIPKSTISIISGQTSQLKTIFIDADIKNILEQIKNL